MAKITITEALSEIKVAKARIEKKREFILKYAVRNEVLVDPLADDGGSVKVIERETQSIDDLCTRIVAIRNAITKSNMETYITIEGVTRSVHDWLVWRREIAEDAKKFVVALSTGIERAQAQAGRFNVDPNVLRQSSVNKPRTSSPYVTSEPQQVEARIVVNVSEKGIALAIENFEIALGTLDGQLSLLNATTFVDV